MSTRDGVKRFAGAGAVVLVVLLALSLCCTSAPAAAAPAAQHGCCETQCATAAPAPAIAVVAAVKSSFERSPVVVALLPRASSSAAVTRATFSVDGTRSNRIEPLTTVQLRI